MSQREIGDVIGVSKGTVSREIRRNSDMRGHHRYKLQLAQIHSVWTIQPGTDLRAFQDERRVDGLCRNDSTSTKGTDFSEPVDEMIAEIEWKPNNSLRKSLGYLTRIEYCKLMFNFEFGVRCTSR